MERNMDVVRQLMLEIEKQPYESMGSELELPDCPEDVIFYHLLLLAEAGLIDVKTRATLTYTQILPVRLTWAGHEFLDASRDQGRWNQAKAVGTKVGGFSFDVMKEVLVEMAKTAALGNIPSVA